MANVYADDIKKPSRQFVYYVVMTLDRCSLTYGIAPCTASGGQCGYSFASCEDRPNYTKTTKDYKFASKDATEILKGNGVLPYLMKVNPLATEIDPKQSITVDARMQLIFEDDGNPPPFDHDKGTGKFLAGGSATFWKRLVKTNPNFKFRTIKLYEGLPNYLEGEFKLKFQGLISNIEFQKDGKVRLTATDNMKRFKNIKVPNGVSSSNILTASMTNAVASASVTDGTEFKLLSNSYDSYLKIIDSVGGDEYCKFTGISTNSLTGLTRGMFGTSAVAHSASKKVIQVAVFANDADTGASGDAGINPVDAMKAITLGHVGIASGSVDTAKFNSERDDWISSLKFRRIIEKPVDAEKLLAQLRQLVMGDIWQNESQKITFRILHPPLPHEDQTTISSSDNIIFKSTKVNLNMESQITRVLVYYDPTDTWGKQEHTKPEDFDSVLIFIDADLESSDNFNEEKTLVVFADWIFGLTEAKAFAGRYIRRFGDPPAIYNLSVDRKDSAIQTGDLIDATTSDFVKFDGSDDTTNLQILSKKEQRNGSVDLKTMQSRLALRYAIIGHATQDWIGTAIIGTSVVGGGAPNDWPTATANDKRHAYIGNATDNVMSDGERGYHIF